MSFVIRDKIERQKSVNLDFQFDKDGYDYIFNKSTSFLDGVFVRFYHKELEFVLKNLEKIDPMNLEILNYIQEVQESYVPEMNFFRKLSLRNRDVCKIEKTKRRKVKNSAIHMAVKEGNNISIDIILSALSQTSSVSLKNFNELLLNIVHQKSVLTYFENLATQSKKLFQKQVLKVG